MTNDSIKTIHKAAMDNLYQRNKRNAHWLKAYTECLYEGREYSRVKRQPKAEE